MRPRLQFSLRFLPVAVLAVACFLGGMALQRRLDEPVWIQRSTNRKPSSLYMERIQLRAGSVWYRTVQDFVPSAPVPVSDE